jgi:Fungal trichothecene efflux pump (TRI12)
MGAILLTSGACSLLLALSWGGGAYAWLSAPVLGLVAVAIGSFMALAVVERRAAPPVLPPELFGNSVFVVGAAVIALATMALRPWSSCRLCFSCSWMRVSRRRA